jgi:hypothetical protein
MAWRATYGGSKIDCCTEKPRRARIPGLDSQSKRGGTEKLTFEEIDTYWNIMHKIDPRSVRHAFEEAFIDRGLTNSEFFGCWSARKSARNGSNSRPPGGVPSHGELLSSPHKGRPGA